MTANLQTKLTVKQACKLMNISERMFYMARNVHRLRPDLSPEIMAGRMTVNEAVRIAEGRTKPTSWDRLVKAWNAASDDDRARLLVCIGWPPADERSVTHSATAVEPGCGPAPTRAAQSRAHGKRKGQPCASC